MIHYFKLVDLYSNIEIVLICLTDLLKSHDFIWFIVLIIWCHWIHWFDWRESRQIDYSHDFMINAILLFVCHDLVNTIIVSHYVVDLIWLKIMNLMICLELFHIHQIIWCGVMIIMIVLIHLPWWESWIEANHGLVDMTWCHNSELHYFTFGGNDWVETFLWVCWHIFMNLLSWLYNQCYSLFFPFGW